MLIAVYIDIEGSFNNASETAIIYALARKGVPLGVYHRINVILGENNNTFSKTGRGCPQREVV